MINIDLTTKFPFIQISKAADDLSYLMPPAWEQSKGMVRPTDFKKQLEAFRGSVFACSRFNAIAVADVPFNLMVGKRSAGQKFKFTKTMALPDKQLKFFLAQREFQKYRRKYADFEEVLDHPLLTLLDQVNPFMNAFDLREKTVLFLELTGNAYWHLVYNNLEVPSEIWLVSPEYMKIDADPKAGKATYIYKRGMKEIKFKNEEIVHFSVPSPLHDFYGIGAVVGAWEAHRIWESMADYEIALFENMGRPDMAIWLKQNINEPTKKRLETKLKQSYVGAKKQGQIGVFSKETVEEIQVLGEKLREMSYLEGRKYIREEISAAHRVPISFWTMESSNRAVAQAALYQHALYTVKPYCTRIVEKLNEKLCPKFDDNIFFVFENPVPDDADYLLKEREAYVSRGIKAINEVRKEIGIEPMDGFDVPWLPVNLIPAGEGGAQVEAQIDEFWEKVFDRGREKLNEFQAAE